jgi:hypothetical protein
MLRRTLCSLVLTVPGLAQTVAVPELVVQAGDPGGTGLVKDVQDLLVNDAGQWVALVITDNPFVNKRSVVLREGHVYLKSGDAAPGVPGYTFAYFLTADLNGAGHVALTTQLWGAGPSDVVRACYLDKHLIRREGSACLAAGLGPGATYVSIWSAWLGESGSLLLHAWIDDPAAPGDVGFMLLLLHVDNATGAVLDETVLARAGDVLPGPTDPIEDFYPLLSSYPSTSEALDLGDDDALAFAARLEGADPFHAAAMVGGQLVSQVGQNSAVPGFEWGEPTALDVGPPGSWLLASRLVGDPAGDSVLVRNGVPFAQEGAAVPGLPAQTLTGILGGSPPRLGADDRVLWRGGWTGSSALFVGRKAVAQTDVTGTAGGVLRSIDRFALSPDGRRVALVGSLDDGSPELHDGALLLELGPWTDEGFALAPTDAPLTGGVPALLAAGSLQAGQPLGLYLTEAAPGAQAFVVAGLSVLAAPFKGGTLVPQPQVLVPVVVDASGSATIEAGWPAGLPSGTSLHVQIWVTDASGPHGFTASNAVRGDAP